MQHRAQQTKGYPDEQFLRYSMYDDVHYTDLDPNLSTYLRLAGHLAERDGNRAAAADYYKQYLLLRSQEEPAGKKQSDEVRAALARMGGEAGR